MNRIQLLPENVANQIAAGEVIERPASVVKELVENSIDAGATQIDVAIRAGGRNAILITDNGWGMSRDDALLCLERHATSKIRQSADLSTILSFGFRGEAIPSIASVSKFRLRSQECEAVSGVDINMEGGKLLDVREIGMAAGTQMEVRSLFYNLPVRRKFLRTEATEEAHIRHQMILFGLGRPGVGFTLAFDGAPPTRWPPGQTLRERAATIYGRPWVDATVAVQAESPRMNLKLHGLIGKAGISRPSRHEEHLYVNGRPVSNRVLQYALLEGYHNSLMRGRYPVALLFLEMDPAGVDVNIHPAKREVRFHDDSSVRSFVVRGIQEALQGGMQGPLNVTLGTSAAPDATPLNPSANTDKKADLIDKNTAPPEAFIELKNSPLEEERNPFHPSEEEQKLASYSSGLASDSINSNSGESLKKNTSRLGLEAKPAPSSAAPFELTPCSSAPSETQATLGLKLAQRPSRPPQPLSVTNRLALRVIGDIAHTYLVAESPEGLVLIDQHAAHERILFEQMLRRLSKQEILAQRLLLPATLQLPPRDADFLRDQLATLNRIGIGISLFGPQTFLVDALPPMIKTNDVVDFIRTLVKDLQESGGETRKQRRASEETVVKTVCRHAIKAHDILAPPEWDHLIADLLKCDLPYTCPHGRPTMILMACSELEKKFGRTA